jgi:soluble P-type ATPase
VLIVEIPGRAPLEISHLALDLNGTLATDGNVPVEILQRVRELTAIVVVHILTADTFGTAASLAGFGAHLTVIGPGDQTAAKAAAVRAFGVGHTAAIGNGMNDEAMLQQAALGILVVGQEGAAVRSLLAADLVVRSIEDALDLFRIPKRLVASLRTG